MGHSEQVQRTLQTLCNGLPLTNNPHKVFNNSKRQGMQPTQTIHLQCTGTGRCFLRYILHGKWTEKVKRPKTFQSTSSNTQHMNNREQHPARSLLPGCWQWGENNIWGSLQTRRNKAHGRTKEETTTPPSHNIKTGNHMGAPVIIHPGRNLDRNHHNYIQFTTNHPPPRSDTTSHQHKHPHDSPHTTATKHHIKRSTS